MWDLDHKEGWALKNWCFWTVVMEKTLESPLDCKEIQPVHPKGDQSWVFTGRTDAKLKLQYYGQLMLIADSLTNTLMQGKTEGGRRRMRWLDRGADWMGMSLSRLRELVMDRESCHASVHGAAKSWTWLSERTLHIWKWAKIKKIFKRIIGCSFTFPIYLFHYFFKKK